MTLKQGWVLLAGSINAPMIRKWFVFVVVKYRTKPFNAFGLQLLADRPGYSRAKHSVKKSLHLISNTVIYFIFNS